MKYENYLNRLIINENIYHFPGNKSTVKDTNRYIFSNDIEKDINNIKEKIMKRIIKPFIICSLNGKYDKILPFAKYYVSRLFYIKYNDKENDIAAAIDTDDVSRLDQKEIVGKIINKDNNAIYHLAGFILESAAFIYYKYDEHLDTKFSKNGDKIADIFIKKGDDIAFQIQCKHSYTMSCYNNSFGSIKKNFEENLKDSKYIILSGNLVKEYLYALSDKANDKISRILNSTKKGKNNFLSVNNGRFILDNDWIKQNHDNRNLSNKGISLKRKINLTNSYEKLMDIYEDAYNGIGTFLNKNHTKRNKKSLVKGLSHVQGKTNIRNQGKQVLFDKICKSFKNNGNIEISPNEIEGTNFEKMIKNIDETNIDRAYYIIMNSVKKTLNLKDYNSNKDIILKYLRKPINNNVFSFKPVNESIFNY